MSREKYSQLVRQFYELQDQIKEERKKYEDAERMLEQLRVRTQTIDATVRSASNLHGKILIIDGRCFQLSSNGIDELHELT